MRRKAQEIIVHVGKFSRKIEARENYISTFIVGNKVYNVIGTSHSFERLEERNIDKYYISGLLMSLGTKLDEYNNSNKHVIISDHKNNISAVITVEKYTIVIVTVLDKGNMNISPNAEKTTIIETFGA